MTPQQFIAKWRPVALTERSASQQHFLDLCDLLGQPKPAAADPQGAWYTFERGVRKTTGDHGWADVWMRGHFAWEYKGKHKDLKAAYQQLLLYREDLANPPLLVVCDMDRFEVHTNFTGTAKRVYAWDLDSLADAGNLEILRKVFTDPAALRPEQTNVGITEAAAGSFGQLADALRQRGIAATRAAHFLMKLIFCFFAEDISLLPKDLFTRLLDKCKRDPQHLSQLLRNLFEAMARGGDFGIDTIAYFDGGLFRDAEVIELHREEIAKLIIIGGFDWGHVEPSIFGTLFERTLDPDKRAQIGAHYTSKADILTLVEPLLVEPLRREWEQVKAECDKLWPKIQAGARSQTGGRRRRAESAHRKRHDKLIQDFVERLAHVRVLDPACGSGNFLYVAIHRLLDLEKEVIAHAADRGLALLPHVRPTQLCGIEVNRYAQQLAQVVVWIGYLQWMHHNGFSPPRDPVLEPIETIRLTDAIVDLSDPAHPVEPAWPEADVIVGNPPFLGGKLLRTRLGDDYVNAMFAVWSGRVARESDLCCYWFEKGRAALEAGRVRRAGLLATQGIRGGANRETLKRIKQTGDIFFAVSDRDWVLDGANVHVSMIGFDDGSESVRRLDDCPVSRINPDLTATEDLTAANPLACSAAIAYMGNTKGGAFDIPHDLGTRWLQSPNPDGRSNRDVLRPWVNGMDITRLARGMWIIDFGCDLSLQQASLYELPFEHVREHVKPKRDKNKRESYRKRWWIHVEPRPAMRNALSQVARFVATPNLTKFRLFVWLPCNVLPDHQLIAFARDDDYFFGVLHSGVHERWSLRAGTALEDRPRYTPTTCFETFPFPPLAGGIAKELPATSEFGGAPDDYDPERANLLRERIATAAAELNRLRESWLNPVTEDGAPVLSAAQLKRRTLTNLYNDRPTWLELAHLELDRAVLAAYGWPEDWADALQPQRDGGGKVNPVLGVADPEVEQQLLARLLALNLSMASCDSSA